MEIFIKGYIVKRLISEIAQFDKTVECQNDGFTLQNKQKVVFVYNTDGDVVDLFCNDSKELDNIKKMIISHLSSMRAMSFHIILTDILKKYGIVENDLNSVFLKNFKHTKEMFRDISLLIPEEAIIGDVIQSICDEKRFRNIGTLIITENGLKPLNQKIDIEGSVYPSMLIENGGFNPNYWSNVVRHNSIIFLSEDLKNQIRQNCLSVTINDKKYAIVLNNDEFKFMNVGVFEIVNDTSIHNFIETNDETVGCFPLLN